MPVLIQRVLAAIALVLAVPLLLIIGLAIRLTSRGAVLHRATRLARWRPFTMYKMRTMSTGGGPGLTRRGDPRITPVGRILRRTKLDELPQLWNVVRGEMLLVGPRPEDPRYADRDDPLHALVFGERPGITGPTALAYRDEEVTLAREAEALARSEGAQTVTDEHVERAYRERLLPSKLALDAEYLRTRSWRGDIAILARTLGLLLRRSRRA